MDSTIKIWDFATGALKFTLEGPSDEIRTIEWHQKGNALISGSADGTLWLWNGNNGENLMVFNGHEKAVNQVNFTPDGKHISSISEDATMRIWNPKNGQCEFKIQGFGFHQEAITQQAFS